MRFQNLIRWSFAIVYFLLGIFSLTRLKIENDLLALFPSDTYVYTNKEILSGHPLNRRILFFVKSKKNEKAADLSALAHSVEESFAAENISDLGRLELRQNPVELDTLRSRVIRYLPWLLTPEELRYQAALLKDTAHLNSRLERVFQMLLSPGGRFVQDALLSDPLGLSSLWFARLEKMSGGSYRFTPDGLMTDSAGISLLGWITAHESAEKVAEARRLSMVLNRVRERLKSQDLEIGFFGAPLVAAENARIIQRDVTYTLLFALVSISLLLSITFRTWRFLPVFLVTLLGGATGSVIAAALMIPHIPALSLGLAAVFIGISVDYALHLLTLKAAGLSVKNVIRRVTRPMLLSMLTTVASFGVLAFTESPVTRALGWLSAGGIAGSCLTALLIAPCFLSSLPEPRSAPASLLTLRKFRKPGIVFTLSLSVVAFFLYKSPTLDADPEKLSYLSTELTNAAETLQVVGGVRRKNMIVLEESGSETALYEQAIKIDSLTRLPEWKTHVEFVSPTHLFPSPTMRQESARVWDSVFSPSRLQSLRSELNRRANFKGFKAGLFENFLKPRNASAQKPPDIAELLAILPAGLREMLSFSSNGKNYQTLIVRVEPEKHDTLIALVSSLTPPLLILDRKQLANAFFAFLKKDFEKVVIWSILMVIAVLLVGFGRVELTAAGFLPLAVAWLWLGALMALTSLSFNLVSLIVCSFTFGLGVDYSIFYLYQQIYAYKYGTPPDPATGKAVKLSALTTLLATGGLILSRHPALHSIGVLSLVGIGAVWLNSALLQPSIYHWLAVKPAAKGLKPHTLKNLLATLMVWIGLVIPFLGALVLAPSVYIFSAGKAARIHNFFRYYIWLWAKIYVGFVFFRRRRYVCFNQVDFSRPVLVFANHQSFIDTALIFSLSPRLVVGTKNNIYNHPLFGPVSRLCGFINVSEGHEKYKPRVLELLRNGYSFALFPEGTRSADFEIHRFHSGLFDLALTAGIPLLPVVFVGTGHLLHKGAFWGSRQHLIMEAGPPLPAQPTPSEDGVARKLAREMAQYLRSRYNELLYRFGGGPVAADLVRHRYLYINPDLEWYVRIKLILENNYESIHLALPPKADIVELGCGLGLLGHILTCEFPERTYTGYDIDTEKIQIALARRGPRQSQVRFEVADISTLNPRPCDVLIVWDVLHYLPRDLQWQILDAWTDKICAGGLIVIREGLADYQQKHRVTQLSEFFSIKVMRFNPKRKTLYFPEKADIEAYIRRHELEVVAFESKPLSSNSLWILRKP
jgi:1-acyl-sn-glycerol-3-phosphate acyltransferase